MAIGALSASFALCLASCMDMAATSRPEKQGSVLLQIVDSKGHASQAYRQGAAAAESSAEPVPATRETSSAAEKEAEVELALDKLSDDGGAEAPPGDPHLDKLQEWFRQALPDVVAEWNLKQERKRKTELVQWESDGQRWGQACKKQGFAAMPGPIAKHFHVVLFEERGSWINSSHPYSLISAESARYQNLAQVEQLLIENVRNTVTMNDATSVHFMDTEACESATGKFSPELLSVYRGEADLRYRADVCRVAALYWEGGYYFDDDMVAYRPIVPLIHDTTEFATVQAVEPGLFFQSFIAATPCHPVLRRNLEMFIEARRPNPPKKYQNLLGPVTLKLAFDEILPSHAQIFMESRYNPKTMTEPLMSLPSYNGFECEFVVYDKVTKKLLFCSRI